MKNQLLLLYRLALIVLFSLVFSNCEKDEIIQLEQEQSALTALDFVAKNVDGVQLLKERKEIDIRIAATFSNTNESEDYLNSSLYGVSINTSNVQVISGDTFESYTFIAQREEATLNILENYVLTVFNDGGFTQMLIKYPYTIENGETTYLFTQATAQYIVDTNLLLAESDSPCPSTSEEIIAWEDGGCVAVNCGLKGNHSPGEACQDGVVRAHWNCTGAWAVTGCVYTGGGTYTGTGTGDPSNATTNGGGSTTGTTTNPPNYPPTVPIIPKTQSFLEIDGLTLSMSEWLNNNPTIKENLRRFLDDNNWSSEAKEEVKLMIQAESIQANQWDYSRTGVINGKQALTYIAASEGFDQSNGGGSYTMYLLENGHILCESTTRRIINPTDGNTIASQDYAAENYYYVQINEIEGATDDEEEGLKNRWYTYRMPPNTNTADCISCGIDYLFQLLIENSLVVAGRYVLPIEDALIVITGEDFYGVESSAALAGSFLIIDIIGIGQVIKILRAVKHVDEVFEVVEAIYRYMDEVYDTQKENIKKVLRGDIPLETGNTIRKGNFGEMVTDTDLTSLGYEPLHRRISDIDEPLSHGIDGVFKNPETGEYLIVESKFNTSSLSTNSLDGKQMSDSWILGTNTGTNRLALEVGTELADEIIEEGYKRIISKISPNGSNYYQLLDSAGNIIEIWFP
ncbi:hypothetical protein [uncultured Kordia sp.]|uniref:hypothetical protein n=1 Tax=uncultured Kordia sp. TaxID=507699 RepID=UPI00261320B2|nr:hypothetical protein [uncultured Kordia sp.]